MTDKPKLADQDLNQADGVVDDASVTTDADTADSALHPTSIGTNSGGLPAEPTEERAARLQRELDDSQDKLLRLAAEFDNFRKRIARERVELADRAQAAFVMKMLDVLDDLDRLVAGESAAAQNGPLYDATVLINRKLWKELEAAGLERLDPAGEPFDPTKHEAVSVVAPPSPDKDHTVSATFQTGYLFKGSLIRPARVQVFSDQGQP
ncbi:MAG: nucleotide exchange factor GrpE [Gemmatimonadota bacterium]